MVFRVSWLGKSQKKQICVDCQNIFWNYGDLWNSKVYHLMNQTATEAPASQEWMFLPLTDSEPWGHQPGPEEIRGLWSQSTPWFSYSLTKGLGVSCLISLNLSFFTYKIQIKIRSIQPIGGRIFAPAPPPVLCASQNGPTTLPAVPPCFPPLSPQLWYTTHHWDLWILPLLCPSKMTSYFCLLCRNIIQTTIIPQQGDFNYLRAGFPFLCFPLCIGQLL